MSKQSDKNVAEDPSLDLKTPWLAAILSWLIPGMGQIYQGRHFKGALFCICILGTFYYGVAMGEGRPVYSSYYEANEGQVFQKRNYGYLSHILLGVSTMPALLQSSRLEAELKRDTEYSPINSVFTGEIVTADADRTAQKISGQIELHYEPGATGRVIVGQFNGQILDSGEPLKLRLAEPGFTGTGIYPVGPEVAADPKRLVVMDVAELEAGPADAGEQIIGSVPRPFQNWYQVPLQNAELQDLNSRLGKRWELAMVFTWIAGLLNILCIWDAAEGPAYGIRPRKPTEQPPGEANTPAKPEAA